MGPLLHVGLTAGLLVGADLTGFKINKEVIMAAVAGGIFLDADKVIEIISNRQKAKKGEIPDIAARCRILHSIFVFPFGLGLSFLASSLLPFLAVLYHIWADSFISSLVKDRRNYPSHPPRKWLAFPFIKSSWETVTIGWPVTYPPEFNWIYRKLGPAIGAALLGLSVGYLFI